jgi:hypothetical protein
VKRRQVTPWRAFLGRFALAHLLSYPVAFVGAIAAMPIAILVRSEALLNAGERSDAAGWVRRVAQNLHLSPIELAQLQIVLEFVLGSSFALFVSLHVASLPWAIGAAKAVREPDAGSIAKTRGYRMFVVTAAATLCLVALIGLGGWLWLFLL